MFGGVFMDSDVTSSIFQYQTSYNVITKTHGNCAFKARVNIISLVNGIFVLN